MPTRTRTFDRRILALKTSLGTRPKLDAKVVERANLRNPDKEILLRAIRNRFVSVSREQLHRLNAALDALPPAEQARVNQAAEGALLVAVSGVDAAL